MMARLQTVRSARRDHQCGKGHTIEKGESYYHWSFRSGSRFVTMKRCMKHKPRPSMYFSQSEYISRALEVGEEWDDFVAGNDDPAQEDLVEHVKEQGEVVRDEIATVLTESADAMEEGFGHETYQSEELRERADLYETWADEIDGVADEIESEVAADDGACETCSIDLQDHWERDGDHAWIGIVEVDSLLELAAEVLGASPE